MVFGLMLVILQLNTKVLAKQGLRRISGMTTVVVEKMKISEFEERQLGQKINQIARMDDIEVKCEVAGMVPKLIEGINTGDSVSELERSAMLYNTWFLQSLISCAPKNTAIYLPEGVFYFTSGNILANRGSLTKLFERHVIRPKSFVSLVGKGTDGQRKTILKPYSEKSEFSNNMIHKKYGGSGRVEGGLDMFFFNDYRANNFPVNPNWLESANFYDFVIDSDETEGLIYNSSGKGFMINLFKNGVWDNVVVKNTDGTGFGVDVPINGVIRNSRAENCGKAAKATDGGASGFGIGTGYSNDETMVIENSVAVNNKKFGFFYEHQGRFAPKAYRSTGAGSGGFVVKNSRAKGNMYNFGGLRANDVSYSGIFSEKDSNTVLDVFFSDESRNIKVEMQRKKTDLVDVLRDKYYAEAVDWAMSEGISNGVAKDRFGVGMKITRADALVLLWRLKNREGKVLSMNNNNLNQENKISIDTCFSDVPRDAYYAEAASWGKDKNIISGTVACEGGKMGKFEPNRNLTRAEFVTMLWRMSGSPRVGKQVDFEDVSDSTKYYYEAVQWAIKEKVTSGVGDNKFAPEEPCTRDQAVTLMYRARNSFK